MAKKTLVKIEDDLDGSPGAKPVTFALDGRSFEIDLTANNRAKLEAALAPFVAAGRASRSGGDGRSLKGGASGLDREELQAIRRWATARGIEVAERGRLSRSVIDAYRDSGMARA